jgi:hypothetical protein
MKRSTGFFAALALVALPLTVSTASAALTDYEGFDYGGTTLNGQSGGTGWNGGWIATGISPSDTLSNDATSLSYPVGWESPASVPATTGARVSTGGATAISSSSRLMANSVSLAVDGSVMFASALIRKNAANAGGVNNDNILLEFVDASGNRRFGLGIEGTGDKPWLNANGSTTPSAGPAVTPGDTYFIVAKIVSSASGLDTAFLKVFGTGYGNQVPLAEPTTWDATLTQTTAAVLDRVRVRIDQGNTGAAPGEVDEIRIGTDWQAVVAVPEPAAAGALGMFALALARRRRRA